ncbi:glutaredoxin 3 [Asaia krungthepensis]|uniref:Glutaredoxin n=1 Tax=Asaia krungthepensis NRIC 0535 TaxID=1307925 RepID=A0ABQ0Q1G7_9PROT|nr:glutaredoxin 3 [Asaia krungthepensis]GBQ86880.1 glutaredoxin [Asaia krungthepensis NRIC 0535]
MPNIEIYTQPGCPYCVRAVQILASKGVKFNEINAPHGTQERLDSISRSGGARTVPQIFLDDRSLGGCTDLMHLESTGELDRLLTLG